MSLVFKLWWWMLTTLICSPNQNDLEYSVVWWIDYWRPKWVLVKICANMPMFKVNWVSDDAIRFCLFPFSLREVVYIWLTSLLSGSIKTSNDMVDKFLRRYFPPSKVARLRSTLSQKDLETLFEAYQRFKDLLQKCSRHGFISWMRVQILYKRLNYQIH